MRIDGCFRTDQTGNGLHMSQHAIEDLVEDSIRLVDACALPKADKQAWVHGLLRVQALYDTSLTWFRMDEILIGLDVLSRTAAPPETEAVDGWQTGEDETGYLRVDENGAFVYRLLDETSPVPLPGVFVETMQLAFDNKAFPLVHDWYGLLVNGWWDGTLDTSLGFPDGFESLVADANMKRARSLADRTARRVDPDPDRDEDLTVPDLQEALSLAADPEQEACLRYLLSPGSSAATLRRDFAMAMARKARGNDFIIDRLEQAFSRLGWTRVPDTDTDRWLWILDVDGHRRFAHFQLHPELKLLMCELGIEHALMLRWQQRTASTEFHNVHFYRIGTVFLPEELGQGKRIHAFGGWKFDIAGSERTLEATLKQIESAIPMMVQAYFDFIDDTFQERYFRTTPDQLLSVLLDGEIIPEDVLFDSPQAVLLAFAMHARDRGNLTLADDCVRKLEKRMQDRPRKSAYDIQYVEPFVRRWQSGDRNAPMPPVLHAKLALHLQRLA